MQILEILYFGAIVGLMILMIISSIRSHHKFIRSLELDFGKTPETKSIDRNRVNSYFELIYGNYTGIVDNTTWNDLDMDDIYCRINVCKSSVGEEYLYALLHNQNYSIEQLKKLNILVEKLDKNPKLRIHLQKQLKLLGKDRYNGLSYLIASNSPFLLKSAWVYYVFSALPYLTLLSGFFILFSHALLLTIFVSFINVLIYLYKKPFLEFHQHSLKYASKLLLTSQAISKLRYNDITEIKSLSLHNKAFKRISRGLDNTFARFVVTEFQAFVDAVHIATLHDLVRYNKYLRVITENSASFHEIFKTIGFIDVAISILSFRKSLNDEYCIPGLNDTKTIEFTDIYHPLVAAPVRNSGYIKRGSIITGSNASGKSTFIKTLAINAILAQTIYTCCAAEFNFKPSLIMTSIALRDNIAASESYFVVEIKSIKRMLDAVKNSSCICFIDEVLRGTNTDERIAASYAILESFAKLNCICIVATHDRELTQLLDQCYDNLYFTEQVTDEGVFFDYKLREGISQTHNAIKLLELYGIDTSIVDKAKLMLNHRYKKD